MTDANFDSEELKRGLTEAERQRLLAAEYAGNLGSVIKNLAEKIGIDRRVLNFVRSLWRKDPAKRDVIVRDTIRTMWGAGFFDHESLLEGEGPREELLRVADLVRQSEPIKRKEAEEAAEDLDRVLH